jgi:D-glycero-D-manno-heptose 1,7-bisphosphate phosphatase
MNQLTGSRPGDFRGAVFLDRDGTIIEEVEYLSRLADIRLLPGAGPAIARLNRHRIPVILVSNQSGIARGYFDAEFVRQSHRRLQQLLEPCGARIDDFFFCPHHPDHGRPPYRAICDCRKPAPGMLFDAARRHGLDLKSSFVVGDKQSDLDLARAVGAQALLVLTGYGQQTAATTTPGHLKAVTVCPDLKAAVDWIIKTLENPGPGNTPPESTPSD